MRDYELGNHLADLRIRRGLSQAQLAAKLGVSDKAVSKWETGAARPGTDRLRALAAVYAIPVDELLLQPERKVPRISRIVITGGPCAGKTTGMAWIANAFAQRGWKLIFMPESATEVILSWITAANCGVYAFQKALMTLQARREKIYAEAARAMKADKILIVQDRGIVDSSAYMPQSQYLQVLQELGLSEASARDQYDAVFHLVTAAKGAREFYTTANNLARSETPEEAAREDDALIAAWSGHPHLRIIDNTGSFEDKMRRLIAEISSFLGEPEPHEIERKFLIRCPDVRLLEQMPEAARVEILQTYLRAPEGEERRIRQRGQNGSYQFTLTTKRPVGPGVRIETEKRLSQEEYLQHLMEADPSRITIHKERWCIARDGQYMEVDLYPWWLNQAILEIELTDLDQQVVIPDFLEVIREVTDDPEYSNGVLARPDSPVRLTDAESIAL